MTRRLKMTVTFEVTAAQALGLQAFFNHWNRLASWGSSRPVSFYVDGDGNFKPKCEFSFSEPVPELTAEMEKLAAGGDWSTSKWDDRPSFDYDPIAGILRNQKEKAAQ